MPKDDVDISHLPPDVQASIKAAKKAAQKTVKKTASNEGRENPTLPPEARAFMAKSKSVQGVADKMAPGRAAKQKYVVQPGDSLSKIAKELLGDATRWPEIFELNKDQIKDPNLIYVGQELRIP